MGENKKKITIHIVGDSIVKTYEPDEFVGGWGEFLHLFMNSKNVEIVNHAEGGRSSRSFINEGRLRKVKRVLKPKDYLFIEFCHNDDITKNFETIYNRQTPLGESDENGIFPMVKGRKIPTNLLPKEFMEALIADEDTINKQAVLDKAYETIHSYGNNYYPYSPDGKMGTYKWFIYRYVEIARSVGAIPVLVTAPPRACFDKAGRIDDGPALHGGDDFAYIRAVRQLAEEESVPLVDLFVVMKALFESLGRIPAHYLTSLKTYAGGEWPRDYEIALRNPAIVSEDTHFNKFGAYIMASIIADGLKGVHVKDDEEMQAMKWLKKNILKAPSERIAYPECLEPHLEQIREHLKYELF